MNRIDKTITVTEAGLRSALGRHRDRNGKHRCPQCVLPHDTLDGAMKCMASHAVKEGERTVVLKVGQVVAEYEGCQSPKPCPPSCSHFEFMRAGKRCDTELVEVKK